MAERRFTDVSGLTAEDNAYLSNAITDHIVAEITVRYALRGKKVRFKGWYAGGHQRTGTIKDASIWGKTISIGVDVDRVDGRPGFKSRPGVLAETWYGDIDAVEVVG